MSHHPIPVFARFQWLNHPRVTHILSTFLKPPRRGRKGYDKVLMFRWLIYRQLMGCSYRDLESMSDIDHSTFVKFRKRLLRERWFSRVFSLLTTGIAASRPKIIAILDSSFVETYSGHDEDGSEYFGYKQKNGFKLHQIIDFKTRLPILQAATPGARADIIWGAHLIRGAPPSWNVRGLLADKAYDGMKRVSDGGEPVDLVPPVLEPVEVQVPLRAIPVEVGDVAVAVRVPPDRCTEYHPRHCPSNTLRAASHLGPQSPPASGTK